LRRLWAGLWTCHRMWAPAAGCGVFLYQLVSSDDPFMWCLYETFFLRTYFFNGTFFFLRKINLVPHPWTCLTPPRGLVHTMSSSSAQRVLKVRYSGPHMPLACVQSVVAVTGKKSCSYSKL
jgi:hypothetical protein